MSLSEDLIAARSNKGIGCKVCYYLSAMNTNEADMMRSALNKPERYTHVDLAGVFKKNGMPLSEAAVRRHRRDHL